MLLDGWIKTKGQKRTEIHISHIIHCAARSAFEILDPNPPAPDERKLHYFISGQLKHLALQDVLGPEFISEKEISYTTKKGNKIVDMSTLYTCLLKPAASSNQPVNVKEIVRRALDSEDNYNLLFIGAPASGKTLFLQAIMDMKKDTVYFDMSNTTNKILDILEQRRPPGRNREMSQAVARKIAQSFRVW